MPASKRPLSVAMLVESKAAVRFDMDVPHLNGIYQPKQMTFEGKLQADLDNGWFEVYVDGSYPSFEVQVFIDALRLVDGTRLDTVEPC